MEKKGPFHQAYILLKIVFVLIPIVAGVDKFFDFLVDWDQYMNPIAGEYTGAVMMGVGVIEIIAGIGVIFKSHVFSYIVGVWLALIILNLILMEEFYDIVLRDFGLCLSAFAFARLAKVYR